MHIQGSASRDRGEDNLVLVGFSRQPMRAEASKLWVILGDGGSLGDREFSTVLFDDADGEDNVNPIMGDSGGN